MTDRLAGANRGAYPATHLLLTSGDAWRPRTFDSGTGPAVSHAWRHCGDGGLCGGKLSGDR